MKRIQRTNAVLDDDILEPCSAKKEVSILVPVENKVKLMLKIDTSLLQRSLFPTSADTFKLCVIWWWFPEQLGRVKIMQVWL